MKIFLGDLVHKWDKKGVWTFPLNIAFISSYTKKVMKEKHEEMKDKERERILYIELFCAKESGQATNDFAAKKIYESCLAANK